MNSISSLQDQYNSVQNFLRTDENLHTNKAVPQKLNNQSSNSLCENLLKPGVSNKEVAKLQQILKDNGYFNSSSTGFFDKETESALINFQKDSNLNETGIVDLDTKKALSNAITSKAALDYTPVASSFMAFNINPSSEPKEETKWLQVLSNQLNGTSLPEDGMLTEDTKAAITKLPKLYLGATSPAVYHVQNLLKVPVTGTYDDNTVESMRIWQNAHKLNPTGEVDTSTWLTLGGRDVYDIDSNAGLQFDEKTKWLQILCNQSDVKDSNNESLHVTGILTSNSQYAISNLPTLSIGSQGAAVTHVQNLLKLNSDGVYSDKTADAVKQWQASNGLSQTGNVDAETWLSFSGNSKQETKWLQILSNQLNVHDYDGNALKEDGILDQKTKYAIENLPRLDIGSTGAAVNHVQNVLKIKSDGVYGTNSANAVKQWQADHGLNATGVVDSDTWLSFSGNTKQETKWMQILCNQLNITDYNGKSLDENGILSIQSSSAIEKLPRLDVGSNGAAVKHVQNFLKIKSDGVYGNDSANAVKQWQADHGLASTGVVDSDTWLSFAVNKACDKPAPTSESKLFEKALKITGSFEGRGFTNITGNFDGQGLSLGILQWCIGQGSLQPLLKKMNSEHNDLTRQILGDQYNSFNNMLNSSFSEQKNWARSINTGNNNISEPWKSKLVNLCKTKEFQDIQIEAASDIANTAKGICEKYNLNSERGFALAFDITVQNGSINSSARNEINSKLRPSSSERERLSIIANAVANASSPQWREDVRARKMTIVNGQGTVHGDYFNLDRDFGLSDNSWR